jgi:hypothetical protein
MGYITGDGLITPRQHPCTELANSHAQRDKFQAKHEITRQLPCTVTPPSVGQATSRSAPSDPSYAPCAQLDKDVQYAHIEAARFVYSLLGTCRMPQ